MADPLDEHFTRTVVALAPGEPGDTGKDLLALFDAQLGSRHLDFTARELVRQGRGFYSIGSAGHEGNAAVAAALRPTDPVLPHYRSGAFYLARAGQVPGHEPLRDVLLGVTAAADEPIAGGRHKVFGNKALHVIPQTSTIASHLPRAVGLAFGIERARKLGTATEWPADAVVVCGFGDASTNHSTATGAFNAAAWCAYQGLPMPVLFLCEDNGIGISVRTPPGWVTTANAHRPGIVYFTADGTDVVDTLATTTRAVHHVRTLRRPAFLHLRMVRLLGHAGSDVEAGYRSAAEITADYARDPLLRTAKLLVSQGILTAAEVLDRYEKTRADVWRIAEEAAARPLIASAADVTAPLARPRGLVVRQPNQPPKEPLTLARSINRALAGLLADDPGTLVFGEDVAVKGGVYGVTRGLRATFGAARVFDTLLDEQTILGTALGTALAGFLPIPEIQYLAYLHNAADQVRGEAGSLRFFSQGQYRNPMIVRIAAYAYQRGFGGHFHNDNAVAALRDIPGLVIASPSRPDDAAAMLRTCAAAARANGSVCVFLEPIALYHTRDLHEPGDDGWLCAADVEAPLGRARVHGDGGDLTLVSFANGLRMSLRVAKTLVAAGIHCRVLDLRWLAPLPVDDLLTAAAATGRVLVVDETRASGGVSETVLTALVDNGSDAAMARVTSKDSYVPLGSAAHHVLLSEDDIERAARALLD
ncbi:MAG TPA: thiamine pyrophosphate-dependent enzyme [Pseudonocardiaceae bacterium]|jgi:2-oxoisovalerate dehydrogenase E1 component|nr:thiamine pyrophosphate-dependent enzyme [Pseudonocardiaceae bacterium]